MAAFPQFVPRLELDVHLKSIDGRFNDLIAQISGYQEQQAQAKGDVERLFSSMQDYATKLEVNHLASRLDLQIACTDASVTEGLDEQRQYTALEVQGLRVELSTQTEALRSELAKRDKEIASLSEAIVKEANTAKDMYATKAEQKTLQAAFDRNKDLTHAQLKSAMNAVESTKVSYQDLEEASASLRSADDALTKDIAGLAGSIAQASQSIACLDQRCHSTFARHSAVTEVSESVEGLRRRIVEIAEERVDVHGILEKEREHMRGHIVRMQELERVANDNADDIHHLKAVRLPECTHRYEKNEQQLQSFGELERLHWEEVQQAATAQKKAMAELRLSCETLRTDMELHIASARQDAEKLRQHSTIRYFDQLDKALAFQETVDRVQRDNQELSESLRSIKLPKV